MKLMKRFLAMVLALLMLLSLAACNQKAEPPQQSDPTEPSTDPIPEPTAAQIFADAAQKVYTMTDARLSIDLEKRIHVGSQTFTETQELTMKMNGIGTDSFTAELSGIIDFGTEYTVVLSEIFQNGTVYGSLSNGLYSASMSAEDFIARYTPAVLLDVSVYSNVEFTNDTTISFSGASRMESWLAQEDYEMIGAVGTAVLDESGKLKSTTYDVTYHNGSTVVTELVTVTVNDYTAQVEVPDDTSAYTQLDHPDIPILLERSYGYSLQSRSLSFTMDEIIASAAIDAMYSIWTQVDMHGQGKDLKLHETYAHRMMDLSGAPIWSTDVTNHFENGEYIYTLDGESTTYQLDSESSIEELRRDVMWVLGDIAYYSDSMQTVTLTEVPGGYVLEYTFDDEASEALKAYACNMILNEGDYLDSIADGYTVQQSEGYMAIDKATGLPTGYSISYTGAHSIDGYDYILVLETTQTIDCASLNAYTAVTGEADPSLEPAESPTPLFYHVTGPDGEEMWLLGTIHLGDQRTANLPEEIYEAFRNSDALAVEYDVDAFDEQTETDPKLAEALAATYMYTDGTLISDHLDPEVYEAAKLMMKFTGEYNSNADMFKPTTWSQTIENFYLRLGYQLTSDYGVDNQLLKLAREQGKKILDVESGLEQAQMLTGYSDELQEYLLTSSISCTPAEYYGDVHEMFEMWCSGDEAALIAMVAPGDLSDMTEEELALYEEYTKAMEWDRNVGMLDVAKGYLDSGETVFYAVGLAHLLSEDGLVNTLRAAGYTVELVTFE